jgi:hypothetical protein
MDHEHVRLCARKIVADLSALCGAWDDAAPVGQTVEEEEAEVVAEEDVEVVAEEDDLVLAESFVADDLVLAESFVADDLVLAESFVADVENDVEEDDSLPVIGRRSPRRTTVCDEDWSPKIRKVRYAYPKEPWKRRARTKDLPSHRPLVLRDLHHPDCGYRLVYRRTDPDRWYGAINRKRGGKRMYVKSPLFRRETDAALWVLEQLNGE